MRQMRDSGVEWIGNIPDNWLTDKLMWHLEEVNISNNPIQTDDILSLTIEAGVIPYEDKGNQGNKAKEDVSQYKIAYPNTLVVNSMNVIIGAVGISKYYGCVSPVYYVFKASKGTDLRYIYYIFTNVGFQKEMRKYSKGIMEIRLRISTSDMLRRVIPLPNFEEQTRIADFLDSQCAYIDNIILRTSESIEEYRKLKQAMITQAVTKGVRGNRPMKDSGIKWIGNIPEGWDIYRISSLYEERREQGEDSLPILTVSINSGVSDRELSDEENERIFVRSEDKTKYARVYPGDLTYNMMRAWQGAFGAVRIDGMVSPAYVIAKPKIEIDSRYMEALLRTQAAKQEMKRYSYGIADFRMRLYWGYFKCIKVCLPTLEEQKEIADYIDEKSKELDDLVKKKEAFLEELESYKKSMIYEYVTGKKEVTR